jgi:ribosome-associated heat shock protein Hsp15
MEQAGKEKLRIDKYLWSIRVFKSRGLATEALDKGRVVWNGMKVKPSKPVHIGETYEIKTEARQWIVEVTGLLYKRTSFQEAIKYYKDLTPIEEKEKEAFVPTAFHTGKRLSKIGRPTKKQRRDLDDMLDF